MNIVFDGERAPDDGVLDKMKQAAQAALAQAQPVVDVHRTIVAKPRDIKVYGRGQRICRFGRHDMSPRSRIVSIPIQYSAHWARCQQDERGEKRHD